MKKEEKERGGSKRAEDEGEVEFDDNCYIVMINLPHRDKENLFRRHDTCPKSDPGKRIDIQTMHRVSSRNTAL